ncbi:hypothetical protein SEA_LITTLEMUNCHKIN_60 [Gordonia phage LittleMunchkin]|nr:hypothetical protein SEA_LITTLEMUNCHKIN_60 [Gordonia phage LittleMunchkin]
MPDTPTQTPLNQLTDTALHVMCGMALDAITRRDPHYRVGALCQIADEMTNRARWHRTLSQLPDDLSQALRAAELDDRMRYLDTLAEETHDPHPRVGLRDAADVSARARHLQAVPDNPESEQ